MKILKWLDDNFELIIMGAALIVIAVVVLIDVFGRTFLGVGITWGQEMSRNGEIVIAAMGISYGVRAGKHIKVDIIQTLFPKLQRPMEIFGDVVVMLFCIFTAYYGTAKLAATLKSGATTAVMQIPTFYIYLIMEIGLILAAFRVVEKYVKEILAGKKGGKEV
jgi:TRAP-type C4-dicarboxylate transport system permease small subunit